MFNGLDRANSSLAQLTNDVRFLNDTPSSASTLNSFRTELNRDDDYGQRVRAFLLPPSTGGYTFWIASDETSQLFLSSDENPANKKLIAWVDPRVQPDPRFVVRVVHCRSLAQFARRAKRAVVHQSFVKFCDTQRMSGILTVQH